MASIEEIRLKDWSEYIKTVSDLDRDYEGRSRPPLFRGLAKYEWSMETTLERYETEKDLKQWSFLDYYQKIAFSKSAIETHTERRWYNFPDFSFLKNKMEKDVGLLDNMLNHYQDI
jgi:hypothetical protein